MSGYSRSLGRHGNGVRQQSREPIADPRVQEQQTLEMKKKKQWYQELTLQQIKLHRDFGWKSMEMGFLATGGNLVVLLLLFLWSSEFRESPGLVLFALAVYAAAFTFAMSSARRSFQQARSLEQELSEHEYCAERCEENGGYCGMGDE